VINFVVRQVGETIKCNIEDPLANGMSLQLHWVMYKAKYIEIYELKEIRQRGSRGSDLHISINNKLYGIGKM
jgi:hypothetical protein